MAEMTEIKYGRVKIDGKVVDYATFMEEGHRIELISIPYGGLYVKRDGEIIEKPGTGTGKYAMVWTKVAGWLGAQEFCKRFNI